MYSGEKREFKGKNIKEKKEREGHFFFFFINP